VAETTHWISIKFGIRWSDRALLPYYDAPVWAALGSGHRKIIYVELTIVEECQTGSRLTAVAAVTECLRTHTPTPTPTHRSAVQIVTVGR
jgi:hypothetical protein